MHPAAGLVYPGHPCPPGAIGLDLLPAQQVPGRRRKVPPAAAPTAAEPVPSAKYAKSCSIHAGDPARTCPPSAQTPRALAAGASAVLCWLVRVPAGPQTAPLVPAAGQHGPRRGRLSLVQALIGGTGCHLGQLHRCLRAGQGVLGRGHPAAQFSKVQDYLPAGARRDVGDQMPLHPQVQAIRDRLVKVVGPLTDPTARPPALCPGLGRAHNRWRSRRRRRVGLGGLAASALVVSMPGHSAAVLT